MKQSAKKYSFSFAQFEKVYLESVPSDDVQIFSKDFLKSVLQWQYQSLITQLAGGISVEVINPQNKNNGFDHPRTLISIICDDMAFIVDSIIALLSEKSYRIENSLHPILYVSDTKVSAEAKGGHLAKAAFFIELSSRLTAPQLKILGDDLRETIGDVSIGTGDWRSIKQAVAMAKTKFKTTAPIKESVRTEWLDFIQYIHDDNFTLLGSLNVSLEKKHINLELKSGLGFLSKTTHKKFLSQSDIEFIEVILLDKSSDSIVISKSSNSSTVHRRVPLDLVVIKQFDQQKNLIGAFILIGLFTSVTYSRSLRGIPHLRDKSKAIIAKAGFEENSHDARALRHIVEKYPRDELFQMSVNNLYHACLDIMKLQERPRIALFLRHDMAGRFISALIYVPRDRFDTRLRMKFQTILEQELDAIVINFTSTIDDSHLVRLLFSLKPNTINVKSPTVKSIELKLQQTGRSWSEHLQHALSHRIKDHDKIAKFVEFYSAAFPISYQEFYTANDTVGDIEKLEIVLSTEAIAFEFGKISTNDSSLFIKLYAPVHPLALSDILPILENMGLKVLAEYPFPVTVPTKGTIWIQDIRVELNNASQLLDIHSLKLIFEDGLRDILSGKIENDRLNQLILLSGVSARRVSILRTFVRYARQGKMPYSLAYLEQAVTDHPYVAKLMINYFEEKFDPARKTRTKLSSIKTDIVSYLGQVKSIDQDRILRAIFGALESTFRTNFYQDKDYISVKLDPALTPELPEPKPFREIFVYANFVEGVHLRGDMIARGGLRWSDRHEDFRTEVLGLMKAQQVKNSVIVPMGAKGGFVVKNPPKSGGREAYQAEGIRCYQTFIKGLLDVTDNQKAGKIISPPNVIKYDSDDSYLVVAADKGTATFSDIANRLSLDYGFWLGDAFASGGSAGYDHKKMGITAKGSWESVKRHFREMNIDTQSEEFDVIGVGDMGGDVFGNGLLQSPHSCLIAAFNHLHIFIDPQPNAKISFKERVRLFKDVKGWDQYNETLLSKGGRIFNRNDKILKLTPEIRARLDIVQTEITPHELIIHILKARADLLYFGGIGTYIKSSLESNQDASDRSNDLLRVNADEINARVIGEGANMAITQRARIQLGLNGVRLNTDFIDNSAGVDTSDHEVNIKILLSDTPIKLKDRDQLLKQMTDTVGALVLRDNYQQTQALSLMQFQSHETLLNDAAFMKSLEHDGLLNKKIEFLPNDEEIQSRFDKGLGLTRPELSLILSYAKIVFRKELLNTNLPDHPDMQDWAINYFPKDLQVKYKAAILKHKLYRQIVATMISNAIINRMGPTFLRLTMDQTGCSADEVTNAFMAVRDAFTLRPLWDQIESLDNKVPATTQLKALRKVSRLAQRETTWFLTKLGRKVNRSIDGNNFGEGVKLIRASAPKILPSSLLQSIKEQEAIWMNDGLPQSLAHELALFKILGSVPDIVYITQKHKTDLLYTAEIYFALGGLFRFDELRTEAKKLHGDTEWTRGAISGVLDSLYAAQAALTIKVIQQQSKLKTPKIGAGQAATVSWSKANEKVITHLVQSIGHVLTEQSVDLAMLTVTEQRLRRLL